MHVCFIFKAQSAPVIVASILLSTDCSGGGFVSYAATHDGKYKQSLGGDGRKYHGHGIYSLLLITAQYLSTYDYDIIQDPLSGVIQSVKTFEHQSGIQTSMRE